MIITIITGVIFWIMTLMLGFFIGKEAERKENKNTK